MAEHLPTTSINRASFDKAAVAYDDNFERLPATRRLRRIIWQTYHRYFRSGEFLLELNCGTGTDAIELASNGVRVLATDASQEMLRETQRKIYATGLHSFIETQHATFQKLKVLRDRVFDGAYSNFGGLNCTRRLDEVAFELSLLVKPGGYVILCIMSKFSLWETLSFSVRGKFRKALRRQETDGALADVHGEKVWVHYYSPDDVKRMFARHFTSVEMYGLNIFTPPPTSENAYRLLGPTVRLLEKLDDVVATLRPFSDIGDHFVIVLQRKS